MSNLKKGIITSVVIIVATCSVILFVLCSSQYREKPFDGMKGKVQKVTTWNIKPDVWQAGRKGNGVMLINVSIFDINGNEICSAALDSTERVMNEIENLFENGECVRSTNKAGNRTLAQTNLISKKRGTLEYSKEVNGRRTRLTVKQSSFGRKHKSVVKEDGKLTTISIIRTDRDGYPKEITTIDALTGKKTIETNIFDDSHNVTEKHLYMIYSDGEEGEDITFYRYGEFEEHGNWKDVRVFNKIGLPQQVVVREIEYWE